MPRPRTRTRTLPPPARPLLSPARAQIEAHAAHVGLRTRTPGESPLTNRWEAEWWNGPTRTTRDYPTEDELIADMRRTFGPPEGDPQPPAPPKRPDNPCNTYQAKDPEASPTGPCAQCQWHRSAHR